MSGNSKSKFFTPQEIIRFYMLFWNKTNTKTKQTQNIQSMIRRVSSSLISLSLRKQQQPHIIVAFARSPPATVTMVTHGGKRGSMCNNISVMPNIGTSRSMSTVSPPPPPPSSSNSTDTGDKKPTKSSQSGQSGSADRNFRLILKADFRLLILSVAIIIWSVQSIYTRTLDREEYKEKRVEQEKRREKREENVEAAKSILSRWRKKDGHSQQEKQQQDDQ